MNSTQMLETTPWQRLYRACFAAALVLMAYCLATMVIMGLTGGQPESVEGTFDMLRENRLLGLLRLDLLTVLAMPLYYVLFLGLMIALWRADRVLAVLAALLVCAGLTLFLAAPSVFSYLALSDRFAAAASDAQRAQILAAGEAVLAADLWHGTGPIVGGLLMQSGAVLVSIAMLRGTAFGKSTAYAGIATHGLDLAHILVGFFAPQLGVILMAAAGLLYLVWFPLVVRGFWRLGFEARPAKLFDFEACQAAING